jgi:hypothetical protein
MTVRQVFYQLTSRLIIPKTEIQYKKTVCRLLVDMRRDVPLMVTRGYPSVSFLYSAGEQIAAVDRPTFIYYFGDRGPSGVDIDRFVEQELRRHAPDCDLTFCRVAVLASQIEELGLQTRPTKKTDSRAKSFEGESVEVDAIDPDTLRTLCKQCITQHFNADRLSRTLEVEDAERDTLTAVASYFEDRNDD